MIRVAALVLAAAPAVFAGSALEVVASGRPQPGDHAEGEALPMPNDSRMNDGMTVTK
jgi:hypothetical protein